ncbi:hypothetical protein EOD39_13311 [Acipenser ruthenus]|uniref:PiggyBac transposable element-derived protein domain-containing protein n=1 Tax=Acipenser ruthenus TaxID=7906 RepID=A0A662YNL4_ACIRT|nr:hypothetical protein EOD39_13311 [Acipenser ruthenus]
MYDKSMGGTDLMDSLIALYHTKIRSKKWYLRIFFHFMDMLCVNSQLLYRRDFTKERRTPPPGIQDISSRNTLQKRCKYLRKAWSSVLHQCARTP